MFRQVQKTRFEDLPTSPYELDPRDIIAGSPNPRIAIISETPTQTAGVFRMSPGKFKFTQVGKEWTLVLRGRIVITGSDGSQIECGPGDLMELADGAETTYEILEEYEDLFIIATQLASDD